MWTRGDLTFAPYVAQDGCGGRASKSSSPMDVTASTSQGSCLGRRSGELRRLFRSKDSLCVSWRAHGSSSAVVRALKLRTARKLRANSKEKNTNDCDRCL